MGLNLWKSFLSWKPSEIKLKPFLSLKSSIIAWDALIPLMGDLKKIRTQMNVFPVQNHPLAIRLNAWDLRINSLW